MRKLFVWAAGALVPLLVVSFVFAGEGSRRLDARDLEFAPGSTTALGWTPGSSATHHALYRGNLRSDRPGELDHRCYATMLSTSSAVDTELPLPGRAFYYIAAGLERSAASGDLILGPVDGPDGVARQIPSASCAEQVFVDGSAPPGGDGSSWAKAYRWLSDAIVHPFTTDEPVEIWVKGDILDPTLFLQDRGARLLGAFLGSEGAHWERAHTTANSGCETDLDASMLDSSIQSDFLLDRVTLMRGASYEPGGYSTGVTLRLTDAVLGRGSVISMQGPTDHYGGQQLIMRRTEVVGGNVEVDIEGGDWFDVRIEESLLESNNGPALRLKTAAGLIGSWGRFEVLGCQIQGETQGVLVSADSVAPEADNHIDGWIASSVIHGCGSDGVFLETVHYAADFIGPMSAGVRVTLQQNTIVDNLGAGLRLQASRGGSTAHPEDFPTHTHATLYDNLITHNAAYGVSEGPDDEAAHISSDADNIGNDFWGNGKFYWDEGLYDLTTIGDVNALPGSHGNVSFDPSYVDRPTGDYHLGPGSLAIGAALCEGPMLPPIDIDGESRIASGDQDLGADEH